MNWIRNWSVTILITVPRGMGCPNLTTYLFLLHELRIGTVIYHIFAKDRGRENCVDFLGVDVLEFPVQDEIIAHGPDVDSRSFTKENEGEDIAILKCVQVRQKISLSRKTER
jgi:hypothetical protein